MTKNSLKVDKEGSDLRGISYNEDDGSIFAVSSKSNNVYHIKIEDVDDLVEFIKLISVK